MINYQSSSLQNEWKLFLYNVKMIRRSFLYPLYQKRINYDTYIFSIFIEFILLTNVILFFAMLERMGLLNYHQAILCTIFSQIVIYLFMIYTISRRIQDRGIPGICVIVLLLGMIYLTHYYGYPIFISIDNPIITIFSAKGKSIDLNWPYYIDGIKILAFLLCFLPDNKRKNRFGEPVERGVKLFGKSMLDFEVNMPFQKEREKDLDDLKAGGIRIINSGQLALRNVLNFRGRTTAKEFGLIGIILLICHGTMMLNIYVGKVYAINIPIDIWFILYVIFFIPSLSLFTRRLHDSYSSAIWVLFLYVPFVNLYVYILLLFGKTWRVEESNRV